MIRTQRSIVARLAWLLFLSLVLNVPATELNQKIFLSAHSRLQEPLAKLDHNVEALINLHQQFSELNAARFENPQKREEVQASVEDIIRILDFIRKEIRANKLRRDDGVLNQLNGMAELMVIILSDLKDPNTRLREVDRKRIDQIEAVSAG